MHIIHYKQWQSSIERDFELWQCRNKGAIFLNIAAKIYQPKCKHLELSIIAARVNDLTIQQQICTTESVRLLVTVGTYIKFHINLSRMTIYPQLCGSYEQLLLTQLEPKIKNHQTQHCQVVTHFLAQSNS